MLKDISTASRTRIAINAVLSTHGVPTATSTSEYKIKRWPRRLDIVFENAYFNARDQHGYV